eukprot:2793910-Rhodomonas_salina.1
MVTRCGHVFHQACFDTYLPPSPPSPPRSPPAPILPSLLLRTRSSEAVRLVHTVCRSQRAALLSRGERSCPVCRGLLPDTRYSPTSTKCATVALLRVQKRSTVAPPSTKACCCLLAPTAVPPYRK